MLLSARMLADVADVNHFRHAAQAETVEGCTADLYFQLVDASVDRDLSPRGRRYMPAAGAQVEVTVSTLDSAQRVVRAATQPFAQDPSIWKLTLQPAETVPGTFALQLQLTEGEAVTFGWLDMALAVSPRNPAY